MEERNSLPRGREFELHLFGKTDVADKSLRRLDFHSAMQGVTTKPLARMNSNGYPEVYNPVRPNWGMTPQLWSSVKKHLPRWHKGEKSNPLLLYISVGTSLDCHHGVDCFFWWKGAYCLIDASLILKHKDGQGKENLRADVLLHPHHLTPEGLEEFGYNVAEFLKERIVYSERIEKREKRKRQKSVQIPG